jgi:tetratricopeptide (TPR) repeat protein
VLARQHASFYSLANAQILARHFDDLVQTLTTWMLRIRVSEDWGILLELLDRIPEKEIRNLPKLALIYVEALSWNHQHDRLLAFTDQSFAMYTGEQVAQILFFRSSSLLTRNDLLNTLESLESALSELTGELRGRALARRGLVLFRLGKSWENCFLEAKEFSIGRNWGLACLNYGHCLDESQRPKEARAIWLEALSMLQGDSYSLAWLRYNLGASYFLDLELLEAERHFLEGQRLSNNLKTLSMQPSILIGLAGVRRACGEWPRAEFNYREAILLASESVDRVPALIGLARTLLFANRATEAIETLELGLTGDDLHNPDVQVARALVLLKLNDPAGARRALESMTSPVVGTNQWLESLCRAELARREGRLEDAVKTMTGLPTNTLHAREEVRAWPELFALLQAAGLPVPLPLEYPDGLTVSVRACGSLQVSVNGRAVTIAPSGRLAELLVFLLEMDGSATLEQIMDAMFPDVLDDAARNRARKAIWKLVETLRHTLGWAASIVALRGAYGLDAAVTWEYDVRQVRRDGRGAGKFLEGVYSDWALEVARGLQVHADGGFDLN